MDGLTLPPGALPLANQKWEAFATARARGLSFRLAYLEAGYNGGESNASKLAQKKLVADRIAFLKNAIAKVERDPNEAFEVARHNLQSKDITLPYYVTELRMQLSLCRAASDNKGAIECLYLIGAATGLVALRPPGRPAKALPKRTKEAQEDHDGAKQQRAPRAPADAPEGEVSEVLGLVDQLGGGLGDEPEEEGPARD